MRLRRGLALYIISILVLLVLITSGSFFYLEVADQESVLKIHEISKARDISFVIQSLINNEVEKLYALSQSLQNHEDLLVNVAVTSVHDANTTSFTNLLEQIVQELNLDFLAVTDEDGRILYNSYTPVQKGQRLGFERLAEVLRGEETLLAMRFEGIWHITSIVPLMFGDVQVGTLVLGTKIDDEFASIFAKATDTQLTFGDTSGILASSIALLERDVLKPQLLSESLVNQKIIREHIADTSFVIGYVPIYILDKPISLAIKFNSSELTSLYEQKRKNHYKMIGLITLSSIIIGTLLTFRIISPLKRLKVQAERTIREITGKEPADSQGNEVKSLVEAFNVMLHSVQNHLEERLRLENELKQQALYDSLTRLPNRVLFFDRLKNLFEHKQRERELLFALLFIDLDHFKKINDSLGHMIGDRLLVAAAQRLKSCTRPGDTVARFGGDEFVVIMDGIASDNDAILAAERIHNEIELPFNLDGHEVFTSASIGIAVSHRLYDNPEDFLRDADTAMYYAKAGGRACHVFFDQSMHDSALQSMQLENDLRRALDRGELKLHYQPIVALQSGTVMGFEALLRWNHPEKGLLYPEDFIPMAEETGVIVPIGEWGIREACRQLRHWQNRFESDPPLTMSVNLSAREFNEDLVRAVEQALSETGIPPATLGIEVTESLIMADSELALHVLTGLRDLGVLIYLDDFGTGYSSLNYIHKFPINILKIDRSFVSNITSDTQAQEIVKAIISLAQKLDLKIIIEGVEAASQLELFRNFSCDLVQGFLFSEPLSPTQVPDYMYSHETGSRTV